jgi:hypothetical protein
MENYKFIGKKRIRKEKTYYDGRFLDAMDNLHFEGKYGPEGKYGNGVVYEHGQKIYEGNFYRNHRHGIGTEYDPQYEEIIELLHQFQVEEPDRDRRIYQGQWRKNQRHGEGQLWTRGIRTYEGSWRMGQRHGVGSEYAEDSRLVYHGTFHNNVKSGKGVFYVDGNQTYLEGEFRNDACHGKARFFMNGKLAFEGLFRHGFPNGQGQLFDMEDEYLLFEGKFKDGFSCAGGRLFNKNGFCNGSSTRARQFVVPILHFNRSTSMENIAIRQEMNLRNYLETGNEEKLKSVTTEFLSEHVRCKFNINSSCLHRNSIITILKTNYQESIKRAIHDEDNIDLFGNEIQIPCFGNDNQIYDILSMEYLFLRNASGDFVNINYIYDNNVRVPNFPIMRDGQRLSSYYCPSLET